MTPDAPFPRQANSIATLPGEDGEQIYHRVGSPANCFVHDRGNTIMKKVAPTKIEVRDDVPGLHGTLWRVCVYCQDQLIMELPYTSVESVEYVYEEDPTNG